MTLAKPVTASTAVGGRRGEAPFLMWPVSRREFYMSIGFALLPPLAWGMILFGWRVVGMLVVTVLAATAVHLPLKWWTQRGRKTVLAHSVLSAMVLVALCQPLWPGWTVTLCGALIPVILWAVGGPGRERLHTAVLLALVLQFMAVPWLQGAYEYGNGILARDRLLMGDIRSQRPGPLNRWPASVDIAGFDAVRMERPARLSIDTLDRVSDLMRGAEPPDPGESTLSARSRKEAQNILDDALGKRLPSVEMLMIGAAPGRVGAVSLIAMLCGGLYLAYRYILRPKSVAVFFGCYVITLAVLAVWPVAFGRLGIAGLWTAWATFPGEIVTLLSYAVFNSDIVFAAVFVLALPGTEPLTGRGRRVFLVTAAILAALLARMNWNVPAATFTLCALMPLAERFDQWFAKRSWMNRLWS
jgi:Na+-translocating ferredoxin:NAD+ oxidoreductase RnfD subunit